MECSCIDADVDDYSEVLMDKIIKSKIYHHCGECGVLIQNGVEHRFEKTFYEGSFGEHRTCLDCSSIRDHLVCSFYWGEIWELIEENIREFGDNQPSFTNSKGEKCL